MDLTTTVPRVQRSTVLALVVATSLVVWTGAPDTFGLPKATLVWIGAVVLAVAAVARVVWERTARLPRSPFSIALAVFVVAVAVTTIASPTLALSVVGEYTRYTGLLSYAAFVVVALTVLRTFDVDEAALLLRVVTVVLAVAGVFGFLQGRGVDPFGLDSGGLGSVGTMGNANTLAGLLAVAVPAAVWVALSGTSSTAWRVVGAGTALLGLAVAVDTGSFQGPAAAAPGTVAVLAIWATTDDGRRLVTRARQLGWVIPAAVVAVLVGAIGTLMAIPDGLRSGFVERGDFWRAALSMFGDNPVLGTGFDTYGQHFLAERPVGHAIRLPFVQAESAHSVPLNLLSGGGLLVGLAWLTIVLCTALALVRGLRRLDGEERLLLGGLGGAWIAYLLQAAVSFDVPALGLLHFVVAASIVAIGMPPHWIEIRLPGTAPRAIGRRGHQRHVVPTSTTFGIGVAVAIGLVLAWTATRPLRADLAAAHAQNQVEDGDAVGAAASLGRATDLAPWQGRYWVLRAQLAEASSEVFDAIEFARVATEREPGSSQYAVLAGRLEARYGDAAEAAALFEEALQRDPHNASVLTAIARFKASTGEIDEARDLLATATETSNDPFDIQMTSAEIERADGNLDAARAAYEAARALAPGNGAPLAGLQELDAEEESSP